MSGVGEDADFNANSQTYRNGCTQGFATGITSLGGNRNGQCVDSPVGWWSGYLTLVIPDEGNRYLMVGDGNVFPLINEKGIVLSGGLRPAKKFAPYPGKPKYIPRTELLRVSDSAAEFVKLWAENHTEYGTPEGSNCTLVVDTKEGYCLEGANFVYGDASNHAVHGPMTDQVFASANFFISTRLKAQAEAGIGAGYNRAKRLWELLVDRQYDCITLQPSLPSQDEGTMPPSYHGGGITSSYFMKCLRDHGNVTPEEGRSSCYLAEERGQSALCVHGQFEYTTNAFFGIARPDHTSLFSCEWITPSQPCMSPFLPVYIGINELPEALATTEAFDLFEKLRAILEYHPEYRNDITKYWSTFEIRAIEESYLVESNAAKLADQGDVGGARGLLTDFVAHKCSEALKACQQMLDTLNGLPILGKQGSIGNE
jgi:hypothetical protein